MVALTRNQNSRHFSFNQVHAKRAEAMLNFNGTATINGSVRSSRIRKKSDPPVILKCQAKVCTLANFLFKDTPTLVGNNECEYKCTINSNHSSLDYSTGVIKLSSVIFRLFDASSNFTDHNTSSLPHRECEQCYGDMKFTVTRIGKSK